MLSLPRQWLPILILAALSPGACRKAQPPVAETSAAPNRATILVINADSLVIDGKHVRLANAFAPEPVPDARCWAEAAAAKNGARLAKSMIRNAAEVTTTPTGGEDGHGRAYVRVSLDGADYGEMLIKAGLAAQDGKSRFEWCQPMSKADARSPDLWSVTEASPGSSEHP